MNERIIRISPYFFNSGLLNEGSVLAKLGSAFAALIVRSNIPFDVLFGPAYKGISLAAVTASLLATQQNRSVGFAYNRKEVKDHGEGGLHVGAALNGKRVIIVDDVITSGKAAREAIDGIKKEGGVVAGVVLIVDREEILIEGESISATKALERDLEGAPVLAVLGVKEIINYLEAKGETEQVALMKAYREKYGVKPS